MPGESLNLAVVVVGPVLSKKSVVWRKKSLAALWDTRKNSERETSERTNPRGDLFTEHLRTAVWQA
jgi:hypothetical protein